MNIICTGNPAKQTVAWAACQRWPQTQTISLSQGYDLCLKQQHDVERFKEKIKSCNVFINASYIDYDVQSKLLELTVKSWMEYNIKGHVFTIGTTLEWESGQTNPYKESKIKLRDLSLAYNRQTGITGVKTTYLIVGGVRSSGTSNEDAVDPLHIIDAVDWVLKRSERIALIQIDSEKLS